MESVDDRARLDAALAAATPGTEATRLGPALKVAATIVAESTRPRKDVVLISDFQRNAWTPNDEYRLPGGTTFTPVAITDLETRNLSVTPAAVNRSRFENQERAAITAGVTNRGSQQADRVALSLELDDLRFHISSPIPFP